MLTKDKEKRSKKEKKRILLLRLPFNMSQLAAPSAFFNINVNSVLS